MILEEDEKSKQSWQVLRDNGAKKIYPAHGDAYLICKKLLEMRFSIKADQSCLN